MWFSETNTRTITSLSFAITLFLLIISSSVERELHVFIKKETPHTPSKRKLSVAQQLDVGSEGKTPEQVEGEIHCDHRGIYSVFQERIGSTQSDGRFHLSGNLLITFLNSKLPRNLNWHLPGPGHSLKFFVRFFIKRKIFFSFLWSPSSLSPWWTAVATSRCRWSWRGRRAWWCGSLRAWGTGTTRYRRWWRTPRPGWCWARSSSGRGRPGLAGRWWRGRIGWWGGEGRGRVITTLTDQSVWPQWTGDTDTVRDTGSSTSVSESSAPGSSQQSNLSSHYISDGQDFPDTSSTLTKLSHKSKPRSKSVDRDRGSKAGARTVSVSEDSGNSSLNTYNTDTIQTNNSDWINVPRGYNMGWY